MPSRMMVALGTIVCWGLSVFAAEPPRASLDDLRAAFSNPPVAYKPHTRWWWMGNALRKEDIAWQLEQMQAQGIGGVEQITMEPVYEKGNHEYLSKEYFDLLRYAVRQARDRDMEFAINFGGPGWIWGGDWVPKEDQSTVLLASMLDLKGPQVYDGPLSLDAAPNLNDLPRSVPNIGPDDRLYRVVAARVVDGVLQSESVVDLTAQAKDKAIRWEVPEGRWQLMGFWLTLRKNSNAVNHLSEGAMTRYCQALGAKYEAAVGKDFGKTVESFFGDSFEVPIFRNGFYWADDLFDRFQRENGYDLTRWLPAIWWNMDGLSGKVRYDLNATLHRQGLQAFFKTFLDWCRQHNVRGRIQPYGFVTDNIEGAGMSDIPEAEITVGEKDAVPWFDTRIGPRTYVPSGAHLYGKQTVTAEAFTYLHWEPYRATLEELKVASDGYFRAGINKLYNHGYIASPEHDVVPTRGFFAAIRISHENIWWPYYHYLADYTARSCALLSQGQYVADVAVYSPLANQWTKTVMNAPKWTREFDWGCLGQLLMGNGYAFDLVNDDVWQNRYSADGAALHLGEMTYRVLILPDVEAIPLETFKQIESYVRQGGNVIALERVPEASTGMRDHVARDAEVRQISERLFEKPAGRYDVGAKTVGNGRTWYLKYVMRRDDQLDWRTAYFDPFLKTLRQSALPDVDIDLVKEGLRNNENLMYSHRRTGDADVYFISNTVGTPIDWRVGLRATTGTPMWWDAHTGTRRPVLDYRRDGNYTRVRLTMAPFESRFVVFENAPNAAEPLHVTSGDFAEIENGDGGAITALAGRNGRHVYTVARGATEREGVADVSGLPAACQIDGPWTVRFSGPDAPEDAIEWPTLRSWTDDGRLRHFSGRGTYNTSFDLPQECFSENTRLRLSLGTVGSVAEVRVNGQALGVHWMRGQTFDLGSVARPGKNELEVTVTNTLINRVSGMKEFPEVAPELQRVFGKGLGTSPSAEALKGFEPLPPSGLLGPVQITPMRQVKLTQ